MSSAKLTNILLLILVICVGYLCLKVNGLTAKRMSVSIDRVGISADYDPEENAVPVRIKGQ